MSSPTLSLNSTLDRVGDGRQEPAILLSGMTRYPLYWRLGRTRCGPDGCARYRPHRNYDFLTLYILIRTIQVAGKIFLRICNKEHHDQLVT